MVYNDTNLTAANNIVESITAINQISGGAFISIMLLTMFIVIFIVFSNYNKKIVLLADSFIMTIISIMFFMIGWIKWSILIIPIVVLFLSILMWKFLPE